MVVNNINMKKQEEYTEIFEEYRELEIKTAMSVSDYDSGKRKVIVIKPEELTRVNELREELKKGLEFLSDEQLKLLYNDDDTSLVMAVVKIVVKRELEKDQHVQS